MQKSTFMSCLVLKIHLFRFSDVFELWCCRRLLGVPWAARKSNQSILKEINTIFIGKTDAKADAPILWPPDAKSQLTGEDALMLGKMEGKRRRGQQRIRWLHSNTNSVDMNLSKFWEIVEDMGAWHAAVHGAAKSWTQFGN